MTPAARRMARLQRWNLERMPALELIMFRAIMNRADHEWARLNHAPNPNPNPKEKS